jgi:hypothetical protein
MVWLAIVMIDCLGCRIPASQVHASDGLLHPCHRSVTQTESQRFVAPGDFAAR